MILEVGNLNGLVALLFAIMLVPPILLGGISIFVRSKHKKTAKVLAILAAIYLIVGLGICGTLLAGI